MSTLLVSFRNLFLIKIPFYVLTITIVISVVAVYFISTMKKPLQATPLIQSTQNTACITSMNIVRLKDYSLTKPILLADVNCESDGLEETKGALLDMIHQQQQYGNATSISVYLRKFADGSWTTINGEEQYAPGSLMKVPILITYLKQAEDNPSLLDMKIIFSGHNTKMPQQNFVEDTLVANTKYTIRELLRRMIVDSDNDATSLLSSNLNVSLVKKLFTDLNLSEPNVAQKDYFITATECARFLRILFNSSYLSHNTSEYALELLTQSKFKRGMIKEIPKDVKVAHKFGESGLTGMEVQLHEEGIFYLDNNPYLLVVMTKGKDFDKMADCISSISGLVYNKFSGKALN